MTIDPAKVAEAAAAAADPVFGRVTRTAAPPDPQPQDEQESPTVGTPHARVGTGVRDSAQTFDAAAVAAAAAERGGFRGRVVQRG